MSYFQATPVFPKYEEHARNRLNAFIESAGGINEFNSSQLNMMSYMLWRHYTRWPIDELSSAITTMNPIAVNTNATIKALARKLIAADIIRSFRKTVNHEQITYYEFNFSGVVK